MSTKSTGELSTVEILSGLLARGYAVSIPWGDSLRYDLIAEKDGKFWRIQCKTAWAVSYGLRFSCSNTSTEHGERVRRTYAGQIECFLVYLPDNKEIYCLPIEFASKTDVTLREIAPKIKNKRILFAADFKFDRLPGDDSPRHVPSIKTKNKSYDQKLCSCGEVMHQSSIKCLNCASKERRGAKIVLLPYGTEDMDRDLGDLVWKIPMVHLAKMFGLSHSGLRKRCISRDISFPSVGYWQKQRQLKTDNANII